MKWFINIASWLSKWLSNYAGAQVSTKRSYLRGATQDAKKDLSPGTRNELQRRARIFEKDNAIVNYMADLWETYTVGESGLQIIPASSDAEWNRNAKSYLDEWGKTCDLISLNTWPTVQAIIARSWFVDGEVFVLKTATQERPLGRRLQLIEAHRIETPPQQHEREGKFPGIVDGVEVSKAGRPIGYWIKNGDGNDISYAFKTTDELVHIFRPGRTGQYRGLPFITPVINDLIDLDDLQELEMGAAKQAARIANVIRNKTGELDASTLRRARFSTSTIDSLGNTNTEDRIEHYKQVLGSETIALGPGEEIDQFKSDRPSIVTQEYWSNLAGKICKGTGFPKLLVFPEGRTQGTIVRAELDVAAAFFRVRSNFLAQHFTDLLLWVLEWGIRTTPLLADAPFDWRRVNSRSPRAVNVDIGRNSAAMLAELQAGATNYDLIYAPLGLDPVEQLRRSAYFARYIRELAEEFKVTPGEISNVAGDALAQLREQQQAEQEADDQEDETVTQ